jgi:hypothetical protein
MINGDLNSSSTADRSYRFQASDGDGRLDASKRGPEDGDRCPRGDPRLSSPRRGAAEPKGIFWNDTLARDFPDFISRAQLLDLVIHPIDVWLRGPRKDWAESLIDERRLREEGYLDPTPVREK